MQFILNDNGNPSKSTTYQVQVTVSPVTNKTQEIIEESESINDILNV